MTDWKLIVRDEEGNTREVDVAGAGTTVGRHASNELTLDARNVSRFHARVEARDAEVLVVDRESYAGTWIDGALLDGEITLSHGERFDIGPFELFVADKSKSFSLPKFTPRRDDETDEEPFDDFAPTPIVSAKPSLPPSAPAPVATASPPPPVPSPPVVVAAEKSSDGAAAEAPDAADATAAPAAVALPEFKITASSTALASALEKKSRPSNRRHHRLVFLAPEPARDPIGIRRAPIVFGTAADATVRIAGESALPTHATLTYDEGTIQLAASEGASFECNGERTERRELLPGDRVTLADTTFVVASRAREYFEAFRSRDPHATPLPGFSRPRSNSRSWIVAIAVILAGLAVAVFVLDRGETPTPPVPSPNAPVTLPLPVVPVADVAVAPLTPLPPDEITRRLDEAQSDVEAFETETALRNLAVFDGRTDVPTPARVRATMLEMAAHMADGRLEQGRERCLEAIRLSNGDTSFLDHESPRVRATCGLDGMPSDGGDR